MLSESCVVLIDQSGTGFSCPVLLNADEETHTNLHTSNTQMIIKVRANTCTTVCTIANNVKGGKLDDNGGLNYS